MSQECKDCDGSGEVWGVDFDGSRKYSSYLNCLTCDATGTIHRTGPYRLADGTWSDGVDRTHRINERKFGEANPQRIRLVCQRTLVGVWKPEAMPFQGEIPISWDDFTHAEAIAYADRMARTNQGETNEEVV